MIQLKVKLDNIDYAEAIKLAFPMIQEQARQSTALWAMVVRNMRVPDDLAIQTLLTMLPQKMQDELVVKALEKYEGAVADALNTLAESKGIKMTVSQVEISAE